MEQWTIPVFNTVGDWGVLAKVAENAVTDEKARKIDQANWQWKSILSVLYQTTVEGIEYCSLIRGWENKAGAAQGDQILKILAQNPTNNNDIKQAIFNLISAEADKGAAGLYGIPKAYGKNPNVKYAAEQHKQFLENDLPAVGARFHNPQVSDNDDASV